MNRFFYLLLLAVLITSCHVQQQLPVKIADSDVPTANDLISRVKSQNKVPDVLTMRAKINVEKQEQEISLTANICMRKDSAIWMSVTAPFGIELLRALLTPDSIWYLNIPQSTYGKHPFSYLKEIIQSEINFIQIQEMISGVPTIVKTNYMLAQEENSYLLTHNGKEKIAIQIAKENYRIMKASYMKSEDDFWEVELSDYAENNGFLLPQNLSLKINTTEKFVAQIHFTKIETNTTVKMPFSIPKSFKHD